MLGFRACFLIIAATAGLLVAPEILAGDGEVAGRSIPALNAAAEVGQAAGASASPDVVRAVADCDRLAAGPDDPNRKSAGVWSERVDADAAVMACSKAVVTNLDEPRIAYEYGRALDAAGRQERAFAQFKKAAEQGYLVAATELAKRYISGNGITKDEILGLLQLKQAADREEATALAELGYFYMNGRLVSKNPSRAIELYRESALAGNARGMLRLGRAYLNGTGVAEDAKAALFWLRRAADLGSPGAAYSVATMLRDGVGTPANLPEAVRLMRSEAENGNPEAQNDYAKMVYYGYGVGQDPVAAIDWYEKAAKGGSKLAHRNLILLYLDGQHVKKDEIKAADHALEAIRLGSTTTVAFLAFRAPGLGRPFITALQKRLSAGGLFQGPETGTFDPNTMAALVALQGQVAKP